MQNKESADSELILALAEIKKAYKMSFPFIFVFFGLLVFSLVYIFSNKNNYNEELYLASLIGVFVSIIGLVVIFFIRASAVKKIKSFFAQQLVVKYLECIFEGVDYRHYSRLDDYLLMQEMYMSGRIDEIDGSDYIRGTYKGLDLEMSDISFTEVTVTVDSKGRRRESRNRFFKGLWCVCDLKKTLQSDLWVTEKKGFFNFDFGLVKTDNEAFNKHFAVRTQTPVEAFYVLTPHMMEYVESMDEKARGATYLCFRRDGKLFIAVNSNRDSFEFGFNCDIAAARNIIEKDLSYIRNLLDEIMSSSYYRR